MKMQINRTFQCDNHSYNNLIVVVVRFILFITRGESFCLPDIGSGECTYNDDAYIYGGGD